MSNKVSDAILGFVVGDALGVPVEFNSRESLRKNPVTGMREFGTYNQPKGTWSDDTSMTLCTMESLLTGVNFDDIMSKFSTWLNNGYMSAHDEVFDIGIGTSNALQNFAEGVPALNSGGSAEFDNGNGSLMRVLPLAFYTMGMPINEKFEEWKENFLKNDFDLDAILTRVVANYEVSTFCRRFLESVINGDTKTMDNLIISREKSVKGSRSKLCKPTEYRYNRDRPIHNDRCTI